MARAARAGVAATAYTVPGLSRSACAPNPPAPAASTTACPDATSPHTLSSQEPRPRPGSCQEKIMNADIIVTRRWPRVLAGLALHVFVFSLPSVMILILFLQIIDRS